MNQLRSSITGVSVALLLAACSSSTEQSNHNGGVGGSTQASTGGRQSSTTGGSSNSGTTQAATGGKTSASSSATGGSSNSNTGSATGGKSSVGGASATGGKTSSTPSSATGGRTTQSSAVGGQSATGGRSSNPSTGSATGGAVATGGATSAAQGGALTGGRNGDGGAITGGSTATGGAAPVVDQPQVVTSAQNAFWKTSTYTEVTSGTADVTVNDTSTNQTWDGFGGAFNEKGWSYLTTQAMKDEALKLLFSKDGCNFAWGRIPIGASDYAMDRYSLNETANDTAMEHFSIERDQEKLIPYIQAAQAIKPELRFWASPWSPPTWMKTGPFNPNTGTSHSNFDGGVMKSDEATLKAFALYLVKFVQAYGKLGINVEMVAPQNEPNYQQNYPSCHWEASTFVTFVGKYLGPALQDAQLSTKVMDGTLSNTSGDGDIGQSVLRDATAKGYIGAIGVQWGMSEAAQVSPLKSLAGSIPFWLSETRCGGTMGSTAPAPNDISYAKDQWGYIRDMVKNGFTAYNAWNMVLDPGGLGIDDTRKWPQNALLVADSGKITPTPAYYVFRHLSQFVQPGAKVVGATGGDAVAFKNPDGTIVAVMYNSGSAKTAIVSIAGKKLQFSLPGAGWATVNYKAS